MELSRSELHDIPVLRVEGDLDHSNCDTFAQAVLSIEGDRVLIDLSDCPYIDSGGLAVFLAAVRDARGKGWVGIVAPNPNVVRLFEIIGLTADPDFKIFKDSDEAAEYVSSEAA